MSISLRAVFLEKKNFREGINASKVEFEKVQQVELIQFSEPTESNWTMSNSKHVVEAPLRRSDRVSHQSDRYYDFLIRDGDSIELDENNDDPITYMDIMQRFDSDKWLETMKFEIESMKINDVWILVDPSNGVKPIACKWVFKRKRGIDRKVEIYKARLVVKDYRQHYGIDYDEIFSLVTMLKPFGSCLR